jgi:hypothetical protein
MLRANRDADKVLGDTGILFLLLTELLVRCSPRVDSQCLRVTDAKEGLAMRMLS